MQKFHYLSKEAKACMPKAPPSSGYNLFLQEKSPQIKAENPGTTIVSLAKAVSSLWKEMSAEAKMVYNTRSYKMKHRYNQEYQEWLSKFQTQHSLPMEEMSKTEMKSMKWEMKKILEIVQKQYKETQLLKTSIDDLKLSLSVTNYKIDMKFKELESKQVAIPVVTAQQTEERKQGGVRKSAR